MFSLLLEAATSLAEHDTQKVGSNPIESSLRVFVRIEDCDSESEGFGTSPIEARTSSAEIGLSPIEARTSSAEVGTSTKVVKRRRSRVGEIRKGKEVKAYNKNLGVSIVFDSQSKAGDFLGVGKGAVSACILSRKKYRMIKGWHLSRVPREGN
jgi:hypothetical protein